MFIDRAKGFNNTGQVTVCGRAEHLKPLSCYVDEVLPQMPLARKTVLLTEKQSMFLSGPHGWRAMFPQFEDQVSILENQCVFYLAYIRILVFFRAF